MGVMKETLFNNTTGEMDNVVKYGSMEMENVVEYEGEWLQIGSS